MKLRDFERIAIIQTAFIGDVALALYLAEAVKILHPSCRLAFMTTPAAAPLVRQAAAVEEIIVFDKRRSERGLRGIAAAARALEGFDCVLSAHRSLRTALVTALARPRLSVGFSDSAGARLYRRRVAREAALHEAERILRLLAVFDDAPPDFFPRAPQPRIHLPPFDAAKAPQKPFVALAPGSVWATKRWLEEHYVQTALELQRKGYETPLVGGADDQALCERIAAASGARTLAGQTSLPEMLAILSRASALISNDSAPTHLANLVGCPVVTIFGPTAPAFGFAPRGLDRGFDAVAENAALGCRPCSPHGTKLCPLGTHECMTSVEPARVVSAVEAVARA